MKKKAYISLLILMLLILVVFVLYTIISTPKIPPLTPKPNNNSLEKIKIYLPVNQLEDCIVLNKSCLIGYNYPTLNDLQKLKEINGKSGKLLCFKEVTNFTKDCNIQKDINENCNLIWQVEYYYLGVRPNKGTISMNSCNNKSYVYLEDQMPPSTPYVLKEIILLD